MRALQARASAPHRTPSGRRQLPDLAAQHDPELGWVASTKEDECEWTGGRRIHRTFPREPGGRRIVTMGCSFTYGAEIPAGAWQTLIERERPDVHFYTLGESAYGADQALLRYRRDGAKLQPNEVWLCVTMITVPRLTHQYRPAYRHWAKLSFFKPRFALTRGGKLEPIANPGHTLQRTLELLEDQIAFLSTVQSDYWVNRAPTAYAPSGASALHYSGLCRLWLAAAETAGRPTAADLFAANEPALAILQAITRRMADEDREIGARFRLVLLPSREMLLLLAEPSAPELAALPALTDLRAAEDSILDPTPRLLATDLAENDAHWMPGTHYSPSGQKAVAASLTAELDS